MVTARFAVLPCRHLPGVVLYIFWQGIYPRNMVSINLKQLLGELQPEG